MAKLLALIRFLEATLLRGPISYVMRAARYAFYNRFYKQASKRLSLRQYCQDQLAHQLPTYVSVPGRPQRTLKKDQIYINARFGDRSRRPIESSDEAGQVFPTRLLVIGDPGSGKTTFAKHLFRMVCQAALGRFGPLIGTQATHQFIFLSMIANRESYLPILLELKTVRPPSQAMNDEDLGSWAIEYIKDEVTRKRGYDLERLFDTYSKGPGLFLLLDGLDEVSAENYVFIRRFINQLSELMEDRSPNNHILLTMRSQFYQQIGDDFQGTFPEVRTVLPFTNSDIYDFLQRWPFSQEKKDQAPQRIFRDLADRPNLREMCRNPLVLSMYVNVDQDNTDNPTPDTRTAFYSQVVEELLVARRSRQLGLAARSALRERRERVLGQVAWENVSETKQSLNVLSWNRCLSLTVEVYGCDRSVAADLLLEMMKDTGIFEFEREDESVRFIHLTFMEFLAASYLIDRGDYGWDEERAVLDRFQSSEEKQVRTRLNEVVPFSAGLASRAIRSRILSDLDQREDNEMLGRCLLETQAYDSVSWQNYVTHEVNYLESASQDGKWLRRLHLLSVALRDSEGWSQVFRKLPQFTAANELSRIARGNKKQALAVLRGFAEQDPSAAYRLAKDLNISFVDVPREASEMCVGNKAFIDLLANEAMQSSAEDIRWPNMISEASLRVGRAAQSYLMMSAPESWASQARLVPVKKQWRKFPRVSSKSGTRRFEDYSLYTAALTLSMAKSEPGKCARLREVLNVKAPGRMPGYRIARVAAQFFWLLVALTMALAVYGVSFSDRPNWYLFAALLIGLSSGAWFANAFAERRVYFYRTLFLLFPPNASAVRRWRRFLKPAAALGVSLATAMDPAAADLVKAREATFQKAIGEYRKSRM